MKLKLLRVLFSAGFVAAAMVWNKLTALSSSFETNNTSEQLPTFVFALASCIQFLCITAAVIVLVIKFSPTYSMLLLITTFISALIFWISTGS